MISLYAQCNSSKKRKKMSKEYFLIKPHKPLTGITSAAGAKNATLVIIASLILTKGVNELYNVPNSSDTHYMIKLLESLGAQTHYNSILKTLIIDTTTLDRSNVCPEIMNKLRASILVMGPLLARFKKTRVSLPGGDLIGARPIDYHLQGFIKMGIAIKQEDPFLHAEQVTLSEENLRISLEYPSVGATENLLMYATLRKGETTIINAALEPEVLDLIDVLKKMGARITLSQGLILHIQGVTNLSPIKHSILPDRMEAGMLLLAGAITKGSVEVNNARADHLDIFLEKLKQMGHTITIGTNPTQEFPLQGIKLNAHCNPRNITVKTVPYPGFPTDLQAMMMATLCVTNGISTLEETIFENRFIHVVELKKMGAQITISGNTATIRGVEQLYGAEVIAGDIRASSALVLAGLVAEGETKVYGLSHWKRGYDELEDKLIALGASINLIQNNKNEINQTIDLPIQKITQKLLA